MSCRDAAASADGIASICGSCPTTNGVSPNSRPANKFVSRRRNIRVTPERRSSHNRCPTLSSQCQMDADGRFYIISNSF